MRGNGYIYLAIDPEAYWGNAAEVKVKIGRTTNMGSRRGANRRELGVYSDYGSEHYIPLGMEDFLDYFERQVLRWIWTFPTAHPCQGGEGTGHTECFYVANEEISNLIDAFDAQLDVLIKKLEKI